MYHSLYTGKFYYGIRGLSMGWNQKVAENLRRAGTGPGYRPPAPFHYRMIPYFRMRYWRLWRRMPRVSAVREML